MSDNTINNRDARIELLQRRMRHNNIAWVEINDDTSLESLEHAIDLIELLKNDPELAASHERKERLRNSPAFRIQNAIYNISKGPLNYFDNLILQHKEKKRRRDLLARARALGFEPVEDTDELYRMIVNHEFEEAAKVLQGLDTKATAKQTQH